MPRLHQELHAGTAAPDPQVVSPTLGPMRDPSQVGFDLRFRAELAGPMEGSYIPSERASVALDAMRGRVYAVTSLGYLYAYGTDGRRIYRRSFGSPIDATPVIDSTAEHDFVYVATGAGKVYALHGATGEPMWTSDVGQPTTATPILTADTIYVVSDTDVVSAIDREDGTVLWTYRRPANEEITITGHAGLTLHGNTLLGAFNDGVVAGLVATDGSVLWEIDTSVDLPATSNGLPRMRDIDTTPVVVGDSLFVASFAAGLYELDANNGSVRHRDETLTGVVSLLALPGGDLFVSSADVGFRRIDPASHALKWHRDVERGSPTGACFVPEQDAIVVAESRGSLLALRSDDASEVGRFESGYGFGATPVVADGVVGALSNAGTLFVLVARDDQP